MCSRFLKAAPLLLLILAAKAPAESAPASPWHGSSLPPLRICADPDNLPYSNRAGEGFDNRIARLLARDVGRRPVFVWSRMRRGFVREQFANTCDVLMGVPTGMKGVLTTSPYYRSSYMFVTRRSRSRKIASFSDPGLKGERIGLQVMEEDLSPPSLALTRSGYGAQLVGYPSFGKAAGDVVRAVATNAVGLSIVWGPAAGYFAAQFRGALSLAPVAPEVDAGVPFVYDIACGVHRHDTALRDALDRALAQDAAAIHAILAGDHVPMLPLPPRGRS